MKYLINLVILAIVGLLAFLLYSGIKEPIIFRNELAARQDVVVQDLTNIRGLQEIYRDIKGVYASNFDELERALMNDSIPTIVLQADPSDPTNADKFTRTVVLTPARDTVLKMPFDFKQLRYVPYTDNKVEFEMQADTTSYQQIIVPVMECMTRYEVFMGKYADESYRKYAKQYDPKKKLGFGSMTSPNLEGNWR
jgi:hypothetical protein